MNSTYGPVVPDGYYQPFAIVTPTDYTAWILIATALGLACSLFFCAIRIFVRLPISPNFGMDDYSLYAATLLGSIQSSVVLGACAKGLGKSVDLVQPSNQIEVQRMYYTSNLLLILSLTLSKLSVTFFFLRLSPARRHKVMFSAALILVIGWAIGSFFALALQCNLSHPWLIIDQDCPHMLLRWQFICGLDILFEVAVVGMAVVLVWNLQSSLSSKGIVIGVFGFRLIMIVAIAFRIKTFNQDGWTTDPLLLEAPFIAWTQSEMNYSLVSATIPSFQNFLKNMNTQFGGIGPNEKNSYGYGTANGSRIEPTSRVGKGSNAFFEMDRLRSMSQRSAVTEMEENPDFGTATAVTIQQASSFSIPEGRPSAGTMGSRSRTENTQGENVSLDSNESQRMMIRKDVAWNIASERPEG